MSAVFDFHIHSCYSSDGFYSPEEIYSMAYSAGLKYFAITDHNEIKGSAYLFEKFKGNSGLYLIPGIEISTWYKSEEIHVLAYGIDYNSVQLLQCLDEYRKNIPTHIALRCEALRKAGFYIDDDDLFNESKGMKPSTVTILNVMKKNPKNDKLLYDYFYGSRSSSPYMNFYLDYNAYGKKAYVDFPLLDFNKVVETMKDECFLSIAHPMHYSDSILEELFIDGIRGLEIYSSYKSKKPMEYYQNLALKYNLTATGGSDFHGESLKPGINIGDVSAKESVLENFLEKLHKYAPNPVVQLDTVG